MKGSGVSRKAGDLQVWWIPQIPGSPFEVDVASVAEAAKLLTVLADYDRFQYENRIKPDYSNSGGLRRWCDDNGDGEPGWEDWYDDATGMDDPVEFVESQPKGES